MMKSKTVIASRATNTKMMVVRCSKQENTQTVGEKAKQVVSQVQSLRRKLEDIRAPSVRENINKVSVIATNDAKFANDVFKELDVFHKDMLEQWKSIFARSNNSTSGLMVRENTSVDGENQTENIFKQ